MSANVWYEEVNKGLIREIKRHIRYKNSVGVMTALEDKAVTVRKPEDEFKSEIFPCVSIYNKDSRLDLMRNNTEPIVMNVDYDNKQVVFEEPAVPFFLNVQIDFWSRYQSEMNDITRTWLMKHNRQFNLFLTDDGGNRRSCNCLVQGSLVKSDLVLDSKRLFHSIINYQIWVELDNETRYNKPMVVERNIDANEIGSKS